MRNTSLEAIRGLAALMVLMTHIPGVMGRPVELGKGIALANFFLGTEAVLVFFLLSGTVIRISFDRTHRSRKQFLWTRATRLVPLYLLAIVISVAVLLNTGHRPKYWDVAGNIFFLDTLQGFICFPLASNTPLWSLSFEVGFYLLFAFTIGKWQKKLIKTWFAISIFAMFSQLAGLAGGLLGQIQLLLAYSSIWLLGYYVVDLSKMIQISPMLASSYFGMLPLVARLVHSDEYYLAIRHFFVSATVLPLFILFNHQRVKGSDSRSAWMGWAIVMVFISLLTYQFSRSIFTTKVLCNILPILMLPVGYIFNKYAKVFVKLEPIFLFLGQVSYSLYILHFPVFFWFIEQDITGPLAVAAAIAISFSIAYVAEFYLQKKLVSFMFPSRMVSSIIILNPN